MNHENYDAANLYDLLKEITRKSARDESKITLYHAFYALAVIHDMKDAELLKQVGGDKEKNLKVISVMEAIRTRINSYSINVKSVLYLAPVYLPLIEQINEIQELHVKYKNAVSFTENYAEDITKPNDIFNLDEETVFLYFSLSLINGFYDPDKHPDSKFNLTGSFPMLIKALGMNQLPEKLRSNGFSGEEHPEIDIPSAITSVNRIYDVLIKNVEGQDTVVNRFTEALLESEIFKTKRDKPQAVFLFAGPPGVGKTLLSTEAAKVLGRKSRIFDMSEYAGGNQSAENLIGFSKTYKNARPGVLTSFVQKNPDSILVFDEIEKAAPVVKKTFLQVLEGARLTDKYTEQPVSFENTILIFTTNAGRELYEENEGSNLSELPVNAVTAALEADKEFPKELISRFASGNILVFNHMKFGSMINLAMKTFRDVAYYVKDTFGIEMKYTQTLAHLFLLSEGDHLDARMVMNRSRRMFRGLLFDLFRYAQETRQEKQVESVEVICENGGTETDSFLYPDEAHPLNVLYVSDQPETVLSRNPWIHFHFVRSVREMKDAFEAERFDLAAVDLRTGGQGAVEENRSLLGEDSEGNRALDHLLSTVKTVPVFVIDHEDISEHEWRTLGARGVYDKIPDLHSERSNYKWYQVARKIYIEKSARHLSQEEKVISFNRSIQLLEDGKKAVIRFHDFHLRDGEVDSIEARKYDKEHLLSDVARPKITFDDVIGARNAKNELRQFIEYAKNPERFEVRGVKVSKGLLLYGPAGTGKTMLAKAMAGESKMAFLSTTAAELGQKGPDAVKQIFAAARRNSPSILFIDEIDAIGKMRTGVDNWTESVLNTLLTQMDGFENHSRKLVFVIAATNYDLDGSRSGKINVIDDALARRFGNRIYVDYPDLSEREAFLHMTLNQFGQHEHITDDTVRTIAEMMVGRSCSYIGQLIEFAVRKVQMSSIMESSLEGAPVDPSGLLSDEVLLECVEEFMHGERNGIKSHRRTAIHEAGHAFLEYRGGVTPTFMTVVSRDHFNGYVMHGRKEEEEGTYTKQELIQKIRCSLAGRAAEVVFFGEEQGINTGASSDLEHATGYAMQIITQLGMHKNQLAVIPSQMQNNTPISVEVMQQVNEMLQEQYEETIRIVERYKDVVEALADRVMEKTQLIGSEIRQAIEEAMNQ